MVSQRTSYAAILIFLAASATLAESQPDQMFPSPESCYARVYSDAHLAKHPAQRVTRILIRPDVATEGDALTVQLRLKLRGVPGGAFDAYGYCKNNGGHTLACGIEGDGGGFRITPAKNGGIMIEVTRDGMSFENDAGFATLNGTSGDDRSFLLQAVTCP